MKGFLHSAASVTVFLLLWECISRSGWVSSALFPPPTVVVKALIQWAESGDLFKDCVASLWRSMLGLCIGVVMGTILGVASGRIATLRNVVVPIINLFRPIPPVALIPLVIVWVGIGDGSKIASTAFACFFPMFTASFQGSLNIPASYLWAAQSAGLSKTAMLLRIVFPATLNVAVAGLRVSIAVAFVMIFVTELAGASQGIGYQISLMHLNYRIDRMMAALAVLAAFAALIDVITIKTLNYLCPWIGKER